MSCGFWVALSPTLSPAGRGRQERVRFGLSHAPSGC